MTPDPTELARKARTLVAATRALLDRAIAILQRLRAALDRIAPDGRP